MGILHASKLQLWRRGTSLSILSGRWFPHSWRMNTTHRAVPNMALDSEQDSWINSGVFGIFYRILSIRWFHKSASVVKNSQGIRDTSWSGVSSTWSLGFVCIHRSHVEIQCRIVAIFSTEVLDSGYFCLISSISQSFRPHMVPP